MILLLPLLFSAPELISAATVIFAALHTVRIAMAKNYTPISMLSLMACLLTPFISIAQNGTLQVIIKNIEPIEGNLVIGIFDKKENFPIDGLQFKKTTVAVADREMTYTVELPSNRDYAIAIFHDRNADGVIDRNWLGIPLEPYGFSNNIRPTFSAPEWEKVKFRLGPSQSVSITLQ